VLGYAGKVNLGKGVMVKKAKPKTIKMSPLTFSPVGEILPGAISMDSRIPLGLRRTRLELFQEWARYNRIKLAAALAGDISTERDAKVSGIYARRGSDDGYKVKIATAELRHVNESLKQYHAVILDSASTDKAVELLTACKPSKPMPKPVRQKLAHARAMAAKGYTVGYVHDGVGVTLTSENYKAPLSQLVKARLDHDAAHAEKFAELGKCKCASHTTGGEFSKARRMRG
jgi:hypothetical protein